MKKFLSIVGLALAMLTTSCLKETTSEINPSVKAVLGVELDQTRTYIDSANSDGSYSVKWSEGDKLLVNDISVAVPAQYVGRNSLTIEVESAAEYKLAYPAELVEKDVLTIDEEQKFVEGSFAVGSGVMVGYSESTDIHLKNLYGYLKFTIAAAENVNRVTVVANGGEAISGTYRLDYKNAAIAPLAGKDIIRVTDVVAVNGKATVVVAVPAGDYSKGFTVKIQDKENGVMSKSLKGAGTTVAAGVIYTMPEVSYAATGKEVLIMNATDLVDFATATNSEAGYANWVNADGEVKLGADIDLQGVVLPQISTFNGVFNGQGFALKNWNTTVAFMANLADGGVLKNLVIDESCSFNPDLTTGNTHVGFIVGASYGIIDGCVNNADITISGDVKAAAIRFGVIVASGYGRTKNCINNGDFILNFPVVDQHIYVGGIVGYYNPGASTGQGETFLHDCVNNGAVKITIDDVPRRGFIGGIVGATTLTDQYDDNNSNPKAITNEGTIARCYNNGDVKYEFKSLASATYTNIGGIIGYSQATIRDCENRGAILLTVPRTGSESASRPAAGGIAGSSVFTISGCVNYGTVTTEGTWASASAKGGAGVGAQNYPNFGGIVGSIGHYKLTSSETLTNCINYGELNFKTIIAYAAGTRKFYGGITGFANVNVTNCTNYGKITAETNGVYTYFGAIVGYTMEGCVTLNCTNYGDYTLKHDISTLSGDNVLSGSTAIKTFFAGVNGYAQGVVSNCHNYGVGEVHTNTSSILAGSIVGYGAGAAAISTCSNNAPFTCYIDDTLNVMPSYTGSAPHHYVAGCIGYGVADVSGVTNNAEGVFNLCTNSLGDYAGIIGYAKGNNRNLINKAPTTFDLSYRDKSCNKQCIIGGIIAKNYCTSDTKVTIQGCRNEGDMTIKNYVYTAGYSYGGGVLGSHESGVETITNCNYSGTIELDADATMRFGGVTGYTSVDLTSSNFSGTINIKKLGVVSARAASVGGLMGYTAQGITGGSVDCVINAQGPSGIFVGGVMGTSGSDTWQNLTVKADVNVADGIKGGLLLGGKVSADKITVNLGKTSKPVTIKKSSKFNGAQIKADGTDQLSGMADIVNSVNVVYAD